MAVLRYNKGGEVAPRAFRRGKTNDVEKCGPTWAILLKTGTRTSSPYKNYVDLHVDEADVVTIILFDGIGPASEDGGHSHRGGKRKLIATISRKERAATPSSIHKENALKVIVGRRLFHR